MAELNYFPRISNGSLLITTRNKRLGSDLSNGTEPADFVPMTPREAEDLLVSRATIADNYPNLANIIQGLDCILLAVAQAAAFGQCGS
jgi:hypothetical protein